MAVDADVQPGEVDRDPRRLAQLDRLAKHPERDLPLVLGVLEPVVDVVQATEVTAGLGGVVIADRGSRLARAPGRTHRVRSSVGNHDRDRRSLPHILWLVPSLSTLPVFIAASIALLLIPGPAVLFIVARSGAQGTRAGLVSVLGVHTATVVHVFAAVAGLSAVVVASSIAFTAVKVVGGVYLIYLGIKSIRSARQAVAVARRRRCGRRSDSSQRRSSSAC